MILFLGGDIACAGAANLSARIHSLGGDIACGMVSAGMSLSWWKWKTIPAMIVQQAQKEQVQQAQSAQQPWQKHRVQQAQREQVQQVQRVHQAQRVRSPSEGA